MSSGGQDKRESRSGEPGVFPRIIKWAMLLVVAMMMVPLLLLPVYRYVNPPLTSVMLLKRAGGASIVRQWANMEDISPNLVRAVLVAEDGRFCTHSGIDFSEVENVLESLGEGERPRGASTITMQLVKNLFLWPQRSFLRKAIELPLAVYAELVLPKRRIMELYLNVVEWDRGIYGAEAAALHYFKRPASKLSRAQAANLAVTLPAPVVRNAAKPDAHMREVAAIIAKRADQSGAYVACLFE